jgi:cobalamin-dependent methionine synthase I
MSASLTKILCGCKEVIFLAVSAGIDSDRLLQRATIKNNYEAFLLDAIGSAMIESFADHINMEIAKEVCVTKRFSPGYSDFPLEFQKTLLDRLNADSTVGISLSDELLMTPMKSITAVIGIL